MSTGYTCDIMNQTFPEFVMRCSRAIGYLIEMRDQSITVPPPEKFEPSPYHKEALERAKKKLSELRKMTKKQIAEGARKEYESRLQALKSCRDRDGKLSERYLEFIQQVENWTPPTKDHQSLKEFMLDQLTSSMKFDCGYSSFNREPDPVDPIAWIEDKIENAEENVKYHRKQYREEVKAAKERTAWVKALRKSLENLDGTKSQKGGSSKRKVSKKQSAKPKGKKRKKRL